jgi:hypothetical protein
MMDVFLTEDWLGKGRKGSSKNSMYEDESEDMEWEKREE